MTLVNIDIKNAGYETGPDDRVVFYSPANRNEQGTIISTAEASVPLVDGQASKELAPGPVVVQILAQGVTDTRPKSGYIPEEGPVSLWDVVLDWTPALVDQGILAILATLDGARDEALGQVEGAVAAEVDAIKWVRGRAPDSIADVTELSDGLWEIWPSSNQKGLPKNVMGQLVKKQWGNAGLMTFITLDPAPQTWAKRRTDDVWRDWVRTDASAVLRFCGNVPVGATRDDLADGIWWVGSGGVSHALGFPETPSLYGSLKIIRAAGAYGSAEFVTISPDNGAYVSTRDTGGWRPWRKLPAADKVVQIHGRNESVTSADDLPQGLIEIWSTSYATTLGLPEPQFGHVFTATFGNTGTQMFLTSTSAGPALWVRSKRSDVWSAWKSLTAAPAQPSPTPVEAQPKPTDLFPDPNAPLESNLSRVVMWGDSLTASDIIRLRLEELQPGVEFFNQGIGGQSAGEVAARQGGAMPVIAVAGGVIPASGDVAVTAISQRLLMGSGFGRRVRQGTICGVQGTLSNAEGTQDYTFSRTASGPAVQVPAGTVFVPDTAMDHRHDAQILWVGRNRSLESDPVQAVRSMISWLSPARRRVLVISVTGATSWPLGSTMHTETVRVNTELRRLAGSSYVDLRRWLIDEGMTAVGVTPTQADLDAVAADTLPPSLAPDGTHFTEEAQRAIADFLHGELVARGWWA